MDVNKRGTSCHPPTSRLVLACAYNLHLQNEKLAKMKMKYKAFCVLALITMCKGDLGTTCEMNSCDENTKSKVNFTYFLIAAVCIFVGIFVVCIYVCFKCSSSKDTLSERRPTDAELNDGVVDIVPCNIMLFHTC